MTTLEETIKEAYAQIPPLVQEALRRVDLRKQFDAIREKHRLHLDEAGVLENETVYAMLGLRELEGYEETLTKGLGLTADQVRALLTDVNERIFLPIQEAMRRVPETQAGAVAPASLPSAAPAPEEEPLEKARILAEIENPEKLLPPPKPAFAPASTQTTLAPVTPPKPEQSVPIPAPIPAVSPSRPFSFSPAGTKTLEAAVPVSSYATIYEQKLTEPTKTVRQEAKFTIRRSSIDPYREPPE